MNGKDLEKMQRQARNLPNLKASPPRPGQLSQLDHDEAILAEIKRVDRIRRATGDFNNALPIVDVSIPETVDIACPLVGDVKVHASRCPDCPHFGGVFQKSWANDQYMFWSQKYGINCNRFTERHCGETI